MRGLGPTAPPGRCLRPPSRARSPQMPSQVSPGLPQCTRGSFRGVARVHSPTPREPEGWVTGLVGSSPGLGRGGQGCICALAPRALTPSTGAVWSLQDVLGCWADAPRGPPLPARPDTLAADVGLCSVEPPDTFPGTKHMTEATWWSVGTDTLLRCGPDLGQSWQPGPRPWAKTGRCPQLIGEQAL